VTTPLLDVARVSVDFPVKGWRRPAFRALRDVSLHLRPGECLGLVGESGSGKTTLGRAILGLVDLSSGRILFDGRDISAIPRRERRALGSDLQVVFQDPYTSLNPAMSIEDILAEPLQVAGAGRAEAGRRVRQLLDDVGLPADSARRLPREFSGGQRQRVAIARALARDPRLIVCDEPVSALDLSTQARVLDLLVDIQERTGVAYLFISHDLDVVRRVSHNVVVLYRGEIVETGTARDVTEHPGHAYTRRLLLSAPVADPDRQAQRRSARQAALVAARQAVAAQRQPAATQRRTGTAA
jgi:peptide/nickel transport system ATP-binding protein